MQTIWFCLIAIMIAMYVVLDGFDLGAGAIHLWVARDDGERQQVIRSIGPVWDGNEVWLLAAGGTLYFAFPALYASGFSGFYLPLMIVLWLLILRGIAVEFRDRGIRCNAVCPGFVRTPHGLRELEQLTAMGVDVSPAALAAISRIRFINPSSWLSCNGPMGGLQMQLNLYPFHNLSNQRPCAR